MKDPADILKNSGPESVQKRMECNIIDFEYLIQRAKSLYNMESSEGKARGVAFIFPYLETLDSEVSRDACIESASLAFRTSRDAVLNDLRRYQAGERPPKEENSRNGLVRENKAPIRMNDELFLLMVAAVNDMGGGAALYPVLRKEVDLNGIENPEARDLYIALEECFVNDEKGAGHLLARINSPELKDFFIKRSSSKEFTTNSERLLTDGIRKLYRKKMERRLAEIVVELRNLKLRPESSTLNDGPEGGADELLAEKMKIDEELRRLKEDSP
jgi:DNA primase